MSHQILAHAPALGAAVNWLFSKESIFDDFAQSRDIKYYITASVDVKPKDGKVKTADLKPYGLDYD